jgi:hypothetical protein
MKQLTAIALLVGACTTSSNVDLTGTALEPIQINEDLVLPSNIPIADPTGFNTTISTAGGIDFSNDFFQNLGTNGRRCVSCHLPTAGWTITPSQVQLIFDLSEGGAIDDGLGLSAIFRTNDGSVSPNADVSTLRARRAAYNMLLTKGLIRVGLPVPANAEYSLVAVDDPYGYASAAELSLFRRPLPATNLGFLTTVMWDGRENAANQTIHFDLSNQANDATQGHAQGNPLTPDEEASIVAFETSTYFAQEYDFRAGNLSANGAQGGPEELTTQPFHVGINDNFGDCVDPACMVIGAPLGTGQRGAPFNPVVFTIYDAWTNSGRRSSPQRAAIARGEALFNTFPITITGVGGLNNNPAFGSPASLVGSCTTCHDTPNVGNHSVAAPLNIGIADASRRTPDMPLYTFRNNTTGETIQLTDPGRGLITGKWSQLGTFKGPILRGLAARAPYFHNGFAADLDAVVDFYNERFNMGLTAQQHSDLVAFLQTL